MADERSLPKKPRKKSVIEARVQAFLKADKKLKAVGVTPLNPGFFAMQRLRVSRTAKAKRVSGDR